MKKTDTCERWSEAREARVAHGLGAVWQPVCKHLLAGVDFVTTRNGHGALVDAMVQYLSRPEPRRLPFQLCLCVALLLCVLPPQVSAKVACLPLCDVAPGRLGLGLMDLREAESLAAARFRELALRLMSP